MSKKYTECDNDNCQRENEGRSIGIRRRIQILGRVVWKCLTYREIWVKTWEVKEGNIKILEEDFSQREQQVPSLRERNIPKMSVEIQGRPILLKESKKMGNRKRGNQATWKTLQSLADPCNLIFGLFLTVTLERPLEGFKQRSDTH